MAKTAKIKKKVASLHSRSARRASSPSLNTDKSLKNIRPPTVVHERESVLAIHQGTGVTKKGKKTKQMSTKQRKRLERGVERAEGVVDKLEKKLEKTMKKEKTVKERQSAWEDMNEKAIAEAEKAQVFIDKEDLLAR